MVAPFAPPPPPIVHHHHHHHHHQHHDGGNRTTTTTFTSQPVPPAEALARLQAYLAAAETQPWLHPHALLTESGAQPSDSVTGGLTLHNLRRVEAALRGVRLRGADAFADAAFAAAAADDAAGGGCGRAAAAAMGIGGIEGWGGVGRGGG